MVMSCAAYNCTQRCEKGISFHQFPKDKELFQRWVQAMRRKDWTPSKNSRICSKHFTSDCYEQNGWSSVKRLKTDAVPSIFSFPDHLQKKGKKRPAPRERNSSFENFTECSNEDKGQDNAKGDNNEKPNERKKRKYYVGDYNLCEENLPTAAVQCLEKSMQVISDKNRRIKVLKQRNRRLLKKIQTLESLIKHLRNKNLTTEEASSVLLVLTKN